MHFRQADRRQHRIEQAVGLRAHQPAPDKARRHARDQMRRKEHRLGDVVQLALLVHPLGEQQRKHHHADERADGIERRVAQRVVEIFLDEEQPVIVVQPEKLLVRVGRVAAVKAHISHVEHGINDEQDQEDHRRQDHHPRKGVAPPATVAAPARKRPHFRGSLKHRSSLPPPSEGLPDRHGRCAGPWRRRNARPARAPSRRPPRPRGSPRRGS